jgi:hypothetical protein
MITTHRDAVRIQEARSTAGKIGFAKAVQRYIKRTALAQGVHLNLAYLGFPVQVVRSTASLTKEAELLAKFAKAVQAKP